MKLLQLTILATSLLVLAFALVVQSDVIDYDDDDDDGEDETEQLKKLLKNDHLLGAFQLMQTHILALHDRLEAQAREITEQARDIADLQEEQEGLLEVLDDVNLGVVPIGFVYIQYPYQPEPNAIFYQSLRWQEISHHYAGQFFRVVGGKAAAFNQTQNDSTRTLEQVRVDYDGNVEHSSANYGTGNTKVSVKPGQWTDLLYSGSWTNGDARDYYQRYYTGDQEVRPVNMAIRVWQRVA